jgi:hypothetical protein
MLNLAIVESKKDYSDITKSFYTLPANLTHSLLHFKSAGL